MQYDDIGVYTKPILNYSVYTFFQLHLKAVSHHSV